SPSLPPARPRLHTLSLHDALPISPKSKATKLTELGRLSTPTYTVFTPEASEPERHPCQQLPGCRVLPPVELGGRGAGGQPPAAEDRKSTRLNSSHQIISYAVFCLK